MKYSINATGHNTADPTVRYLTYWSVENRHNAWFNPSSEGSPKTPLFRQNFEASLQRTGNYLLSRRITKSDQNERRISVENRTNFATQPPPRSSWTNFRLNYLVLRRIFISRESAAWATRVEPCSRTLGRNAERVSLVPLQYLHNIREGRGESGMKRDKFAKISSHYWVRKLYVRVITLIIKATSRK